MKMSKFFKKKPFISIIIASYNHEGFVKEAVLSVLNQSIDQLFEVIIVDDGSSDKTVDVIKKIKDDRIKLLTISKNRLVHPRNLALKMARGKYVAFQNSDDVWKQGKLKKQVDILENNPEISACFTGVNTINEKGQLSKNNWASTIFCNKNRTSVKWLRRFFDKGNCLCISSALIRKNKIKRVGNFKESFIQLSDLDLWVRLAAEGEIHIINEGLTSMRILKGKNLSEPSAPSHRRFVAEYMEILEYYSKKPILNRLKEIFESEIPQNATTDIQILGALSKHAWTLSPIHFIFANKLLGKILNDPMKRKELVEFYGTEIIHDYIKQKGRVDINVVNENQ